jgi:hypothetical protein
MSVHIQTVNAYMCVHTRHTFMHTWHSCSKSSNVSMSCKSWPATTPSASIIASSATVSVFSALRISLRSLNSAGLHVSIRSWKGLRFSHHCIILWLYVCIHICICIWPEKRLALFAPLHHPVVMYAYIYMRSWKTLQFYTAASSCICVCAHEGNFHMYVHAPCIYIYKYKCAPGKHCNFAQ